eukprot:CAMPEP_0178394828 /NCGR_PEP_ID=MMETSP0689_2-20121128/12908_1 /TAXON_ID=160604 /ORGANISM="Amphidinium massartii, Strain CS-259" /LENGTH=348 /DNA_ID=CAMNT_0020015471 /DNA_START=35 /DNA_END=1081 /DNA_ORIENTATION=-
MQHKKGDKVTSTTVMEVGGGEWSLEVWPKGADNSTEGFVRFALACSAPTGKSLPKNGLRCTYQLSVVHPHGGENTTKDAGSKCCVFKSGEGWGWDDFMKLSVLEKTYVHNDEVIFEGVVTVLGREVRTTTQLSTGMDPSQCSSSSSKPEDSDRGLVQDMRELWKSGNRSDVILRTADGEDLRVHSYILEARSAVLASMLGPKQADDTYIVAIDDVELDTLRRLVEFLYTATTQDACLWSTPDAVGSLMQAAVKYGVPSLVELCARHVAGMIDVENVAEFLLLATRVGEPAQALKEQCLQFITMRLSAVQSTEAWGKLMQDGVAVKEVAPLLFQALAAPPAKKAKGAKS